ncbi:MAG: UDP-N-acetylmuramoyl-L-alanyl-D-glutamate--2,6-diaminopimelate ligase [Ruminococcaceae bacterium]|nr:UDP-N-acetylmuramoyl-L-alanyl-D-glutamate--2,6-diaminopimelate ligase [Oscillospiraceae bacterium]
MTHTATVRQFLAALPTPPTLIAGDGIAADFPMDSLVADSRRATIGSLFVCIRGAKADGHRYLATAYAAGCRCFLVERQPDEPLPPDACLYLSRDTRRDLALLAAAYYGHPARQMKVIGITGTKGKTSTAWMCHHILQKAGIPSGYIGTCGVHYGQVRIDTANTTPDPLLLQRHLRDMKQSGVQIVLLEVSSQALWQHRVTGIPFHTAVLTNLSPDHIGGAEHPDFDHYAACKRRLLTDFGAQTVIANADDIHAEQMLTGVRATILRCGKDTAADVQAINICRQIRDHLPGIAFTYRIGQEIERVFLPLPGEHNVYNALLALTVTHTLGVSLPLAATALSDLHIPGRFDMIPFRGALVVVDYAHNGASLRAALETLRDYEPRRLVCLFGSVGERTQCRRRELGDVANELSDFTYLTADHPGFERVEDICADIAASFPDARRYLIIPDRARAVRTALESLCEGEVLLLAGKGDEQSQAICGRLVPYSDRAVVEAYLSELAVPV